MKNEINKDEKGLYRSRSGVIFGVCRGFGEHYNFNVFWVRVIMVMVFVMTGLWPMIGIYILTALIMKPEPVYPLETEEEHEFYDSYVHSRRGAAQRLKRRYDNMERRIRRMEDAVTAREFDWDRKL